MCPAIVSDLSDLRPAQGGRQGRRREVGKGGPIFPEKHSVSRMPRVKGAFREPGLGLAFTETAG